MTDTESVQLGAEERDALLGAGGTGVLSLSSAGDEPPHSVPVSYGYDAAETAFYFRLAAGAESDKTELAGRSVTFVTYGQDDEKWQSVVAKGVLEPTDDEDIAIDTLAGLERVFIPYVDIFEQPVSDVTFEFYRLVPDQITGRKER